MEDAALDRPTARKERKRRATHATHAPLQPPPAGQLGVDEAGRGALAGPVVAAAVMLAPDVFERFPEAASRIRDSKKMTPKARADARAFIEAHADAWAVAAVDAATIDDINILNATLRAMHAAVDAVHAQLGTRGGVASIAVDGDRFRPYVAPSPSAPPPPPAEGTVIMGSGGCGRFKDGDCHGHGHGHVGDCDEDQGAYLPYECVVRGDDTHCHIAAASILAKEHRDAWMHARAEEDAYRPYCWGRNAGYGTALHIRAVREAGASDLHRRSFLGRITAPRVDPPSAPPVE